MDGPLSNVVSVPLRPPCKHDLVYARPPRLKFFFFTEFVMVMLK